MNNKDLVDALREAKKELDDIEYIYTVSKVRNLFSFRNRDIVIPQCVTRALSKINPILNELEE